MKNKIIAITSILIIMLVILFVSYSSAETSKKYDSACQLANSGSYDEAIALFKELNNYSDSSIYLNVLISRNNGINQRESGSYEAAIETFNSILDYYDVDKQLQQTYYEYAVKLENNGQYIEASKKYKLANGYKDSSQKSAELNALYSWKASIIFYHDDDDTRDEYNHSELNIYGPVWYKATITGGEPNASVKITQKISFPDGDVDTKEIGTYKKGSVINRGWSSGIYFKQILTDAMNGKNSNIKTGPLTITLMDENGNILAEASVQLTKNDNH
ncbi:MAG: hypothetical protein E7365_04410 [Clostridiales bacterium]|nr:hypothetical protein [Clostridiales bacterium]